jgi:hypothetical protein
MFSHFRSADICTVFLFKTYYKNWAKRGIWTVNDFFDNQGNIMSFQDFQQTYNLRPMFLQFYGITLTVKKWLKFIF